MQFHLRREWCVLLVLSVWCAGAYAQVGAGSIIQTYAGTDFTFQAEGQPATNAPFGSPQDVGLDAAGNVYIADLYFQTYRVTRDGIVRILAGNQFRGCCSNGIDARAAQLFEVRSISAGPDGSIYIGGGGFIQRVLPDGTITSIAGGGNGFDPGGGGSFGGDGGPAIRAAIGDYILGMIFDAAGNLYFADARNNRVRKIATSGIISTIAGNGQNASSGDGGPATSAAISFPRGLRFDSAGNLYISDTTGRIRKVAVDGTISTFVNGLSGPAGLDFDSSGNLYVAELSAHRVRKISPDGKTITTIAGSSQGFGGDGGPAISAQLNTPLGLKVDAAGNILVADSNNGRIRRIVPGGSITTIAGNGLYRFSPDGTPATLAFFSDTYGVAVSPSGLVYVADRFAGTVYRIEADGTRTRVAGVGTPINGGNGPSPALTTGLSYPQYLAFDRSGNLYISDLTVVRRVTPGGTMVTYAGGGSANPGDGGLATSAALSPQGLVVDNSGNLYISESAPASPFPHRIRKVNPVGIITTFAGTGTAGLNDGPGSQAQFNGPAGMAIDSAGNLYVADQGNNRIRKITPDGTVSTFAGGGPQLGDGGPASQAAIFGPFGLAFDFSGALFIGVPGGNRVRRIGPEGIITTLAGNGQPKFAGDGGPAQSASLYFPTAVATDPTGNLFIADSQNTRVRVVLARRPSLSVSPLSLSFTVRSGAAPPAPQMITVSGSVGLPFTISTGGSFISATASSFATPATVGVTVDTTGLTPGNYAGSISLIPGLAGADPIPIRVNLTVQPALPSLLAADATGLQYAFVRGGPPANKRVQVSNSGGGTVDFTVTSKTITGGAWLSVSPAQGSATGASPVSLTVTANPAGLNPGTYVGSVSVADADGTTTLPILVTMTVSASGQSIRLSQTGLTFTAVVNGGPAPPQSFAVINTGQGAFQFTAATITAPGSPNWLSVTPASGSSDVSQPVPTLNVSVDPTGLSAGSYYGRIQVKSASADNSPQELTVVLNLLPDGTDPGPLVQPAGLVFTGVSGGSDPPSQTVLVTNLSATPVSFGSGVATLDGGKYIAYQPANAMVAPGSVRLVVQPSFAGLSAGIYRGAVTLVFSNGSIRTISILIVLAPAGATPGNARAAAGCTPSRLLPLFTSLGDQFNVPASFPTTIAVRVVDDCGTPATTGSVVSTFSNGDPALPLISLRDGRWSGAWVSRNTAQRQVSITVTAENPQLGIRGTVQATGGLSGDNRPPVIQAGGVVSASSFVGLAALAPGSMVSIFGAKLSDGTAVAQTLPLDTQLAGTTVLVAGKSVPLLFSSDGQVNALLPFDIPVNARIQMLVSRGAQISVPEELYIAPAQPGVYTTNGFGSGQGDIFVVTSSGEQRLADPTAPARAGDVLVIYCSGLGPVDQPVVDGAPAPTSPLARTVNPVNLTIGGVTANVLFAGLAPNFSGLYQVNAVVPAGIPGGDQTPLVITAAGQASQPVTMAIR